MSNFFDIALNRILGKTISSPIERISFGNKGDYVVLLHGILRLPGCMNNIAKALEHKGYEVINFRYPSRRYPIDILADSFLDECIKTFCTNKLKKIHFVTHSLGGIVLRKYLKDKPLLRIGRVVMIAPPNHGSIMVDVFKNNFLFKLIFGVTAQQLGTGKDSYLNSLPQQVNFELGVIAGNKSINPLSYFLIKQKNDGIVTIQSTKISGMKDHVTLPKSHYMILYNKKTIAQTLHFIANGQFF